MRASLALLVSLACAPGAVGCASRSEERAPGPTTQPAETVAIAPEPPVTAAPPPSASIAARESVCGASMALVEGNYCLTPEHRCLAHQDIPSGERGVIPNQCTRYAEPATCFENRRRPVRYCMDRYEWPNQQGELPRSLTSWQDARAMCEGAGKRLCTEDEFNFACEGESMKPYVYGFSRDATKCNFDKPYRKRTFTFLAWDACMADGGCKAAFEAIDQRTPAGSVEDCRSDQGVYDLNGNVNEWVLLPNARTPHRSGLKGGWWGPVRDRCRPTVTFHDEGDFGYEVGFRCCADAPK